MGPQASDGDSKTKMRLLVYFWVSVELVLQNNISIHEIMLHYCVGKIPPFHVGRVGVLQLHRTRFSQVLS